MTSKAEALDMLAHEGQKCEAALEQAEAVDVEQYRKEAHKLVGMQYTPGAKCPMPSDLSQYGYGRDQSYLKRLGGMMYHLLNNTAQGYLRTPEAENNPRECSDDLVSLSSEAGAPAAPVDAQGGVSATEKDRVLGLLAKDLEHFVSEYRGVDGYTLAKTLSANEVFIIHRALKTLQEYKKIGGG